MWLCKRYADPYRIVHKYPAQQSIRFLSLRLSIHNRIPFSHKQQHFDKTLLNNTFVRWYEWLHIETYWNPHSWFAFIRFCFHMSVSHFFIVLWYLSYLPQLNAPPKLSLYFIRNIGRTIIKLDCFLLENRMTRRNCWVLCEEIKFQNNIFTMKSAFTFSSIFTNESFTIT